MKQLKLHKKGFIYSIEGDVGDLTKALLDAGFGVEQAGGGHYVSAAVIYSTQADRQKNKRSWNKIVGGFDWHGPKQLFVDIDNPEHDKLLEFIKKYECF